MTQIEGESGGADDRDSVDHSSMLGRQILRFPDGSYCADPAAMAQS